VSFFEQWNIFPITGSVLEGRILFRIMPHYMMSVYFLAVSTGITTVLWVNCSTLSYDCYYVRMQCPLLNKLISSIDLCVRLCSQCPFSASSLRHCTVPYSYVHSVLRYSFGYAGLFVGCSLFRIACIILSLMAGYQILNCVLSFVLHSFGFYIFDNRWDRVKTRQLYIRWIPSHVGMLGNEKADAAAK